MRRDDFDELDSVAPDPLIWEQHPASDRYEPDVFRAFVDEALQSGGAFAVLDTATGRIIGSSRDHGYDAEKREIEIGWTFLARDYWSGVYNRELKRLMLDHAFQVVDRVVLLVGPGNIRSQRAMEKIGGVRVGITHARGQEAVVYEIVR